MTEQFSLRLVASLLAASAGVSYLVYTTENREEQPADEESRDTREIEARVGSQGRARALCWAIGPRREACAFTGVATGVAWLHFAKIQYKTAIMGAAAAAAACSLRLIDKENHEGIQISAGPPVSASVLGLS